jgi:hypothetical protein
MKKMPSLFIREFEGHNITNITNQVTKGCEWVLEGRGIATEKYDGTCCLIKNGKIYKRYDAKQGKIPPEGAIPCQDKPDPITTHWPHWVECKENEPADKYHLEAFNRLLRSENLEGNPELLTEATYELIGPHFQTNPYNISEDILIRHGMDELLDFPKKRTFESIKEYLENHNIEGIVFWEIPSWKNPKETRMCKIKRTDFGFIWNNKRSKR